MKMTRNRFRLCYVTAHFIGLIGILALPLPSLAAESARIEVVETVPLETDLGIPGVRKTADVWLEMIQKAKTSIDLEQFYISGQPNSSFDLILSAIKDAAQQRSVKVRLIVDQSFLKNYPNDVKSLAATKNIQVKIISFASTGGIQHAKYFVVDKMESFVGSANFDWRALTHIHEVGLRITDAKIASDIESVFNLDWNKAVLYGNGEIPPVGIVQSDAVRETSNADITVLVSPTQGKPSGISDSLAQIVAMLEAAKTSIKIQIYDYTTRVYGSNERWNDLDLAIRRAAERGVSVQLMVDAKSLKQGRSALEALAKLKNIQVRTLVIPAWSGGEILFARLVHSKFMITDQTQSWVGSENWSKGYFKGCRNLGIKTSSSDVAVPLVKIFDQLWASRYATGL